MLSYLLLEIKLQQLHKIILSLKDQSNHALYAISFWTERLHWTRF